MTMGHKSRLCVSLVLTVLAACNLGSPPGPSGPTTPVIFISLDTLRADVFDGPHRESLVPHLERFRADAVTFNRAFAQMPFTLPSHMSMWTGLRPTVHQVTTKKDRLYETITTLPEILKAQGYRTIGWMSNDWIKGDFGFARGFDSYSMIRHDLTYADRLNVKALESITLLREGEEPWFLFLHYMDPHSDFNNVKNNKIPYYVPAEYRHGLEFEVEAEDFCDAAQKCATDFLIEADRLGVEVDADKVGKIYQLYLQGIRSLDASLGELFSELRSSGVYDEALILVTSDHGEEFREHGLFLHSQTYDETVRIPLFIKLPGSAYSGRAYDGLAETIDLLPTILDVLGLGAEDYVQGRSLIPALQGDSPGKKQHVLSQDKLVRSKFCLRTSRFKLIYDIQSQERELYDLEADPAELREVSALHAEEADRLQGLLLAELRQDRRLRKELATETSSRPGDSVLTEEERKRLETLGYVDN